MNKISAYILTFFLCFSCASLYAQHNGTKVVVTNGHDDNFFYHTIERGQTVYAIATMYGVGAEDIYRLNPGSKESIKAGAVLKIPQRNVSGKTTDKKNGNYQYHTIQPKETLYSLSVRYKVPATAILDANPGLSVTTFNSGKIIRIPAIRIEELPTTEVKTITKEIEYQIEKKETMYSICRKFNVSSYELIKLNPKLKEGVKSGMKIKIPVKAEENVTSVPVAISDEREVNALLETPKNVERVNKIHVALMLPFGSNEARPSDQSARSVEYYEGFLLAVDSLQKTGCSIDLSVYDTGDGTKKLKEILNNEESLKEANLIIGAISNEQIGLIADFAGKNNIRYVIPFTSKNDDVLSNAFVYQVNTPHSYLYDKASQAGCDLFADDNIIILNIKDSKEKTDFIKTFKNEMKQRNIAFKDLKYNSETFAKDIEALIQPDKRNVVVPTSGSLDAVNKIKIPLRVLADNKPEYRLTLFGYPEWQTYMSDCRECLDDFHALNTYIYSSFYADNLSKEVSDFYTKYKTWYSKNLINIFPKYGILGFDTGMYFLGAIHKYGKNFENNLDKINYKSIQMNFDFHRVNNWGGFINTNIFIVHYQNDYNVTRNIVK